ncbi:hypothetical protein AWB78_00999 [Caballeronia calidae]|uniref:Uncharacterized protein n=1 Tax=Caballeronia calidae TaxID=1777139 RepID=A0A157ZVK6_9BURK|nr:hypothetical protein AWB78_00999 [Caballeronia calidae]
MLGPDVKSKEAAGLFLLSGWTEADSVPERRA